MIDLITLKNFQKHKNTTLELSSGINAIIGETDQGKSSIIRALYWFFKNRPSGDEFIRMKSKECCVDIHIDEKVFQRVRSKSGNVNKYVIDGTNLTALRAEVPEQIKELGVTQTNIQFQHDAPFMLSLNPGEVARQLNDVSGLNQIDSTLKYVNGLIREQTTNAKHIKKNLENKKKELKKYKKLDEIKELFSEYEKLQNSLVTLDKSQENVSIFVEKLEASLSLLAFEADILSVEKTTKETREYLSELEEAQQQHEKVARYIQYLSDIVKMLEEREKQSERLSDSLTYLEKKIGKFDNLSAQTIKARKYIKDLAYYQKTKQETQSEYQDATDKFEKLKASLKVCPLCEQPLTAKRRRK